MPIGLRGKWGYVGLRGGQKVMQMREAKES